MSAAVDPGRAWGILKNNPMQSRYLDVNRCQNTSGGILSDEEPTSAMSFRGALLREPGIQTALPPDTSATDWIPGSPRTAPE